MFLQSHLVNFGQCLWLQGMSKQWQRKSKKQCSYIIKFEFLILIKFAVKSKKHCLYQIVSRSCRIWVLISLKAITLFLLWLKKIQKTIIENYIVILILLIYMIIYWFFFFFFYWISTFHKLFKTRSHL